MLHVLEKAEMVLVSIRKLSCHWSMILKWMLQEHISGHGVKRIASG